MSQFEQSREMTRIAYKALDDKKGEEIKIIDIHDISVIADYFIIAHGNNKKHVQALIDEVKDELTKAGHEPLNNEGYSSASWILLDYGNIIVHVFGKEDRLFYDLERIWRDGKEISLVDIR